jgi:hypothetical protein
VIEQHPAIDRHERGSSVDRRRREHGERDSAGADRLAVEPRSAGPGSPEGQ